MTTLRMARPLWLDRLQAPAGRQYGALRGRVTAEVAIVGGGITGAAVAWMFANAGVRVALVDRALVGHGSTAASTALLMQETDRDFRELAARYGASQAARIWRLSRDATREFIRIIRRLKIPCGLETLDSIYYTTDRRRLDMLKDEFRQRRRRHLGGRWLDSEALKRATGIDGEGGIRTRGNGQVDPYQACLGLLRAAESARARVFERSPVRRIVANDSHVDVVTPAGSIRAETVVIATGYATPEFKPLAGRCRMMQTYVVATRPLPIAARQAIGLGRVMLWDTERPYNYARWTGDHRLLLGGSDRPRVGTRSRRRAFAEGIDAVRRHFTGLYPALAAVESDYAWEGLFATTPDALPYVGPHRRYPRHLFALGYGGNGMTFGFLAARLLLEMFEGKVTADHRLFGFNRWKGRSG